MHLTTSASRNHKRRAALTAALSLATALLLTTVAGCASGAVELRKEMPAKGTLRRGEVVYVDDGRCPAGQVGKVIGGNQQAGAERQVECVKKPDGR